VLFVFSSFIITQKTLEFNLITALDNGLPAGATKGLKKEKALSHLW